LRDGLDRILVDLHSVYRDVLRLQLGATDDLINLEYQSDLLAVSTALSPEDVLEVSDAIATTRERISRNVSPVLALESLLVTAIPRRVVA
jgi:DNA polymerase-3 subunit delta'